MVRELLKTPGLRESIMLTSEWKGEGGSRDKRGVKPTPLRSASGDTERRGLLLLTSSAASEDVSAMSEVPEDATRRFTAVMGGSDAGRELVL